MSWIMLISLSGVAMTLSASSWWMAWLGVEVFGLFFIPAMKLSGWSGMKSSLWHYYLIQSISSSLLLMLLNSLMNYSFLNFMFSWSNLSSVMLLVPIFMKLGLPPFHSWILSLSGSLTWLTFFLVNSIAKIGPLVILHEMVNSNLCSKEVMGIVSLVTLMFILPFYRESMLRQLLVYSGMVTLCWTMAAMTVSLALWVLLFSSYILSMMMLTWELSRLGPSGALQVTLLGPSSGCSHKFMILLMVMNISGYPPTPMFFMKLMVLWVGAKSVGLWIFILMILSIIYLKVYYSLGLSTVVQTFTMSNSSSMYSSSSAKMMILILFSLFYLFFLLPDC
nr:NADH dehydrogenase subunit 2 [Linognathus vituli]